MRGSTAVRMQRCNPCSVGPKSDGTKGDCSNRFSSNRRGQARPEQSSSQRGKPPRTGLMKPPVVRSLLDHNTCPEPPHCCCWIVTFTSLMLPYQQSPATDTWHRDIASYVQSWELRNSSELQYSCLVQILASVRMCTVVSSIRRYHQNHI